MCTSLAEFATKFFVCENRRGQSYKAFIGLSIRAEMVDGASPSTWKFGRN